MVQNKPEPSKKEEPRNPSNPALQGSPTEEGLTSRNLETGKGSKRQSEESP